VRASGLKVTLPLFDSFIGYFYCLGMFRRSSLLDFVYAESD